MRVVGGVDEQLLAGGRAGHQVDVVVHLGDGHLADRRSLEAADVGGSAGDHVPGVGHGVTVLREVAGGGGRSAPSVRPRPSQPSSAPRSPSTDAVPAPTLHWSPSGVRRVRSGGGSAARSRRTSSSRRSRCTSGPTWAKPKPASRSTWWKTSSRSRMKAMFLALTEELARGALQAVLGVVGPEPGELGGERGGTGLDVGDQLGQGPVRAGLDVGVAALRARVHRLAGAVDGRAHERGQPVGVAGQVGEHVPTGPALAQRRGVWVVERAGGDHQGGGLLADRVEDGGRGRVHVQTLPACPPMRALSVAPPSIAGVSHDQPRRPWCPRAQPQGRLASSCPATA